MQKHIQSHIYQFNWFILRKNYLVLLLHILHMFSLCILWLYSNEIILLAYVAFIYTLMIKKVIQFNTFCIGLVNAEQNVYVYISNYHHNNEQYTWHNAELIQTNRWFNGYIWILKLRIYIHNEYKTYTYILCMHGIPVFHAVKIQRALWYISKNM